MAEMARTPDFLKVHVNLGQRVSNLETGVHPTLADTQYWDTYPPTLITDSSAVLQQAGLPGPRWSRRSGHVHMHGKIQGNLTNVPAGGEVYGTLPEPARPDEQQRQLVACSVAPFFLWVQIEPDGELRVFVPQANMGAGEFSLDNVVYPVD